MNSINSSYINNGEVKGTVSFSQNSSKVFKNGLSGALCSAVLLSACIDSDAVSTMHVSYPQEVVSIAKSAENVRPKVRKIRSRGTLSDEETKRLIAKDKAEHPEDFRDYECRDLTKEEFAKLVTNNSARVIKPMEKWL